MAKIVDRVVVFTQENHTTDNYFTSLRGWGANVATGWPTQPNPPAHDQAHSRAAYAMAARPSQWHPHLRRAHPARHRHGAALLRVAG